MNKYDVIEKRIMVKLDEVIKHKTQGDIKWWTRTIKGLLGELGYKDLGHRVCAGGKNKFEQEWLYDLVWYRCKEKEGLLSVPLVMECEWSPKWYEIKYDFEKLLLSNSEHRLMICEAKKFTYEELIEKFKRAVNNYKLLNEGDRFLIAILREDTDNKFKFQYELIIK